MVNHFTPFAERSPLQGNIFFSPVSVSSTTFHNIIRDIENLGIKNGCLNCLANKSVKIYLISFFRWTSNFSLLIPVGSGREEKASTLPEHGGHELRRRLAHSTW